MDEFLNKHIERLKTLVMLRGKRVKVLKELCGEEEVSFKWMMAKTTNYVIDIVLKPLVIAGLAIVGFKTVLPRNYFARTLSFYKPRVASVYPVDSLIISSNLKAVRGFSS